MVTIRKLAAYIVITIGVTEILRILFMHVPVHNSSSDDDATSAAEVTEDLRRKKIFEEALAIVRPAEYYDRMLYNQVSMLSNAAKARLLLVQSNSITRGNIEIVIARHKESIVWSDFYANHTTVYDKGGGHNVYPPNYNMSNVVYLPNVGRESHTYLYHIANNYHNLADVTVFTQGTVPNHGYRGPLSNHNSTQGHLKVNSTFHDFVLNPNGHFAFSGAVYLPTLSHCLFGQFAALHSREEGLAKCPLRPISKRRNCEFKFSFDHAGHGNGLLFWITRACIKQDAGLCSGPIQWDKFIKLPYPDNGVVFFDQGSIFSVTAEQIRRRPIEDYVALLRETEKSIDPYIGYFLEWFWYYLLTSDVNPCKSTPKDFDWAKNKSGDSGHEYYDFTSRLKAVIKMRRSEAIARNLTHLLPTVFAPNYTSTRKIRKDDAVIKKTKYSLTTT